MEKLKQAANADLAADVRLEKWAGTAHDDEEEEIEAPFEQTVDPSQLNFDFGRFEHPKKRNDDEDDSGSSECSESSSSDSYGQIDDTVLMEMQNLEHIFKNMGLNFRMIDRIGEGEIERQAVRVSQLGETNVWFSSCQGLSPLCIKQKT